MNDLLAPIFMALNDEADSFWIWAAFMSQCRKRFLQLAMTDELLLLRQLVFYMDPTLGRHLGKFGVVGSVGKKVAGGVSLRPPVNAAELFPFFKSCRPVRTRARRSVAFLPSLAATGLQTRVCLARGSCSVAERLSFNLSLKLRSKIRWSAKVTLPLPGLVIRFSSFGNGCGPHMPPITLRYVSLREGQGRTAKTQHPQP